MVQIFKHVAAITASAAEREYAATPPPLHPGEYGPALASRIDHASLQCRSVGVSIERIGLLKGKDVLAGCVHVASNVVETPQDVAETIRAALDHVFSYRVFPCANCGMTPVATAIDYPVLARHAIQEGLSLSPPPRSKHNLFIHHQGKNELQHAPPRCLSTLL